MEKPTRKNEKKRTGNAHPKATLVPARQTDNGIIKEPKRMTSSSLREFRSLLAKNAEIVHPTVTKTTEKAARVSERPLVVCMYSGK